MFFAIFIFGILLAVVAGTGFILAMIDVFTHKDKEKID
jgi:uncharacterized membrane protein YbaN (DUF454 family)